MIQDSFVKLNNLLDMSDGGLIVMPDDNELSFKRVRKYSYEDIAAFERRNRVKLPSDYKEFLVHVGACECYVDVTGLGIKFLPIEVISEYVQVNYEDYLQAAPNVLIVLEHSRLGDVGAFSDSNSNKNLFTLIPHDEDVVEWLGDGSNWIEFDLWLERLIESFGSRSTT